MTRPTHGVTMALDRVTHPPIEQQWINDPLGIGQSFVEYEETVGEKPAGRTRILVLTRLAEHMKICEILGLCPQDEFPGDRIFDKGRVWEVTEFSVVEPTPVLEAGCRVYRAVLQEVNGQRGIIDFRLVSR